jgi:hypothetical protein
VVRAKIEAEQIIQSLTENSLRDAKMAEFPQRYKWALRLQASPNVQVVPNV